MENADLRKKLEKKNYDQVYKENTRLNMELKSMYIVMEENKDLKEDLDRLKNISYDEKVKHINQENADLKPSLQNAQQEIIVLKNKINDATLKMENLLAQLPK